MKDYDWVSRAIEDTVKGKKHKRRIQSGIDHLKNKKLYKYYSFDSPYTEPNLWEGNIYLQNPVLFNDPFDCHIGISVNQLVRMVIPDLFDKITSEGDASTTEVLKSWLLNDDIPDLEENAKEHLISTCSQSPTLLKMINKIKQGYDISDNDALQMIMDDPVAVSKMIKTYLALVSNNESLEFDDTIIKKIINSPRIVRNLMMNFDDTSKTREEELLFLLSSQDDFFTKVESIADFVGQTIPREDIAKVYKMLDDTIQEMRRRLGEKVGVECFTKSPSDVLMWSYYANKHSGICVEYDFSKLFSSLSDALLLPVNYSKSRPLLNIQNIYDPVAKQVISDRLIDEFPNIINSWITKSEEWEREKEWRLILFPIHKDCDRKQKLPIISRIITGINISDDDYEKAEKIAEHHGVPIYRTRLKNDQYKIEIID